MRVATCVLVVAAAGCRPSASVQQTLPVANLQSYRTVGLRVKSTAFAAQGQAVFLESAVIQKLRQQCGFEQVAHAADATSNDLLLDLNITHVGRGGSGGGLISNPNRATMHTLLVVTEGETGDVIGTAQIRGQSSGIVINNSRPEAEAIDIVAKTVADVLAKSGCTGPRIAKAEPPPEPTPPPPPPDNGSATVPDESRRAEADALNREGMDKLRSADIPGAVAAFQQANAIAPDPRYLFNLCLTYEAQDQWAKATEACTQARGMNPDQRLMGKIDARLALHKQRR